MAQDQPPTATVRLAERLRELREHEFTRLTQGELGRALGGAQRLSTATISVWEPPATGRSPCGTSLTDRAPPSRVPTCHQMYGRDTPTRQSSTTCGLRD